MTDPTVRWMPTMKWFVNGFAIWIFLASLLAFIYPPSFLWLNLKLCVDPMLGVIMLGMGLTLKFEDFLRVAKMPRSALSGVALQFTIMPLAGYLSGRLFNLDTPYAVGLILVSCCPGGTASNVISYIAKADLALSVSMTAVSTIVAVLATPLLTTELVGSRVDINPVALITKTAFVVLIPVAAGLSIRLCMPKLTRAILPYSPPMAVLFIVLIVAAIVAVQRESIRDSGVQIIAAVASVHLTGATLGYVFSRFITGKERAARTTAIEVGMQNGGLGISLATSGTFSQASMVSLPCAFSALASCLIGSILAAVWSRLPLKDDEGEGTAGSHRVKKSVDTSSSSPST